VRWYTGGSAFRIDRRESLMELDQRLHVPVRVAHDWWNAGEEAYIIVESSPGERFEEMIVNLLGLAQDGKTKRKGDAQPLAGRDLHPGVQ
jgi:hypothetical protein